MLVELKLSQWIEAGLTLYRDNPILVEQVFYDSGQTGFPEVLAPGLLVDSSKRWIPNEYAGGRLRYGDYEFPILGNTPTSLQVEGDPSVFTDTEHIGYQVIPIAVAKLTEVLTTQTFTVSTAFPLMPTSLPAFTIRLEKDSQAEIYIGESLESYILQGIEVDANRATMTGQYLVSFFSVNRLETLWIYAWLSNYTLRSIQQFASWGLSDVAAQGSDIDPLLQFMPEHTYARHLLLTATRDERAIAMQDVEYVNSLYTQICGLYTRVEVNVPKPMGV